MKSRPQPTRIFLLSPANLSGRRASFLLGPKVQSELGLRLRREGAPLGEIFSFVSGLYFRGKLAYANAFSACAGGSGGSIFIITSGCGLLAPDAHTSCSQLQRMAETMIHVANPEYRMPLERDLVQIASRIAESDEVVLLGSVATPKYLDPLVGILGNRLMIPSAFVGLGDMSRGSLMLRAARDGRELAYAVAVETHGCYWRKTSRQKAAQGVVAAQ